MHIRNDDTAFLLYFDCSIFDSAGLLSLAQIALQHTQTSLIQISQTSKDEWWIHFKAFEM